MDVTLWPRGSGWDGSGWVHICRQIDRDRADVVARNNFDEIIDRQSAPFLGAFVWFGVRFGIGPPTGSWIFLQKILGLFRILGATESFSSGPALFR